MKKTTKIALIVLAAVVAGIVLFNLLPDGIRICSTISAGGGTGGWYHRQIVVGP